MREYLLRELAFESGDIEKDGHKITIKRTRTSTGFAGISITVEYMRDGVVKKQDLNLNTETVGDSYEIAANEIADLLDTAAGKMCALPDTGIEK